MASKKGNMRILLPIFLVLLLAIGLPACSKIKKDLPVIRIGHAPHDHHSPLYIAAADPDYFKKNGGIYLREIAPRTQYMLIDDGKPVAKVAIDSSIGGRKLIRKLAENHFDMAFGGVPAIISYIDQGSCIKIISPVMTEGAGLVVRKNLPAANWQEFVDFVRQSSQPVRIGFKIDFSVQNLIFEHALAENGLSFAKEINNNNKDIILLNLHGPKNLIPALENELIEGFVVNQPYVSLAEYRKVGKFIASLSDLPPTGKWKGNPCCALAGCINFAAKNPVPLAIMTTLLMRANTYIKQYPRESAQIIADWLKIPVEIEEKSLPTIHFNSRIDDNWQKGIDFWVRALIEEGKLKGKIKKAYENGTLDDELYLLDIHRAALEKSQADH